MSRRRKQPNTDHPDYTLRACSRETMVLFFPAFAEKTEARQAREPKAIAICAGCPIRQECGDAAERRGEQLGIWGGRVFDPPPKTKGRPPGPRHLTAVN